MKAHLIRKPFTVLCRQLEQYRSVTKIYCKKKGNGIRVHVKQAETERIFVIEGENGYFKVFLLNRSVWISC